MALAWPLVGLDGLYLTLRSHILLSFRRVEFAANIGNVYACRRQLQAHFVHRISDDLRHRQIPEPFVVRQMMYQGACLVLVFAIASS